jgi:hypothetical protein
MASQLASRRTVERAADASKVIFMNEITITAEMTLQEYIACYRALVDRKGVRTVLWAILAVGAACLASSAALTWGSPASILAGLALAIYIFCMCLSGQITAKQNRESYKNFKESNTSYTFTNEQIMSTSRYAQGSIAWAGVDRVIETATAYLLAVGNRAIFVLKRNIPPHDLGEFIQLLRTHHLLKRP